MKRKIKSFCKYRIGRAIVSILLAVITMFIIYIILNEEINKYMYDFNFSVALIIILLLTGVPSIIVTITYDSLGKWVNDKDDK